MNEIRKIQLSSKVLKISESKDKRYIELEMFVSNTDPNLNGVVTTAEFLRKNHSTIEDMPLVVDKRALESNQYSNLTHKYDGENLNTDMIGVFKSSMLEYNINNEDDITMYAKAIVYTRYPKTVSALKRLYAQGELKFSWEIQATEVQESNGLIFLLDGSFDGHCIVSQPAYGDNAKATQLVASLAESYISDMESVSEVPEENNEQLEQDSNLGVSTLSEEVKKDVGNEVEEGGKAEDMDKNKISETLEEKPVSTEIVENKAEVEETTVSEENTELTENAETTEEVVETEVVVEEEKVEVVEEAEVVEDSNSVTDLAEKVIALSEMVKALQSEIESLRPFKERVEQEEESKRVAEVEANRVKLSELVKKFVKEDEIPEEVSKYISEVDEKSVKLWIAEKAIEVKKDEDDEQIVIETSEGKELVKEEEEFKLV